MESFTSLALNTLTKYKITAEAMIVKILNSTYSKSKTLDGITYSTQGHVTLSLMAKTESMEKAISIYEIYDH